MITALAPMVAPAQVAVRGGSIQSGSLSFDGKATLGDFTGTTGTILGSMTGGPIGAVRGWVEAPVNTLLTGNERRDKDLNKSMESERFPTIRFELDSALTRAEPRPDSVAVALVGRFTIHGVTLPVSLDAAVLIAPDRVRVVATTPLNLKDYKIGHLARFLGVFKMNEHIVVHVDVTFSQDQPPSSRP